MSPSLSVGSRGASNLRGGLSQNPPPRQESPSRNLSAPSPGTLRSMDSAALPTLSHTVRLLIVEDSSRLRESLKIGLERSGFAVDVAADGVTASKLAAHEPYDLIVLDLMLPEKDGFTVLQELRQAGTKSAVLILSAKDAVEDRIQGLDLGADDYLVKPFAFEELLARINALLRRQFDVANNVISVADLKVDLTARTVIRNNRTIDLTAREFMLLKLLALRTGQTVSRIEIEDKLYGMDRFPNSNVVASTVSLLRSKIGEPCLIHTRRGLGYVLASEPS